MTHDGIHIIYEEFNSLAEWIGIINKRKLNMVFEGTKREYLASNNNNYDFFMTNSYEEATMLALNGYKEGLDQMRSLDVRITHMESKPKNIPSVNVVGYAPHVPNAIAGYPMSMITTQSSEQKAKVITIVYNMSAMAATNANNFVVAGKKMLDVIITLETNGYRVGLNILDSSTKPSEWAFESIQIKHWRQPSNPLKISYALIHPSFFRRHGSRWLETSPELTDLTFANGYGRAFYDRYGNSMKERSDKLRELGILKQNQFYVEFQKVYQLSPNDLIKEMGIGG
jgi:hypothetical protein